MDVYAKINNDSITDSKAKRMIKYMAKETERFTRNELERFITDLYHNITNELTSDQIHEKVKNYIEKRSGSLTITPDELKNFDEDKNSFSLPHIEAGMAI